VVARLVDLAVRRPWALLVANLLFLAGVMAIAIAGANGLPIGSLAPEGSSADEPDLIIATTGRQPVESGVYRTTLRVISSQVDTASDAAQVEQGPVSPNGRSTTLLVTLNGLSDSERQEAVERIETGIDPGRLEVSYGGQVGTLLDARHELATDFWKLELLAMPFVALILAVAFGPRLAAGPVICAATAIAGALAGLVAVGLVADMSLLGIAPAAVVGLVLGVEAPSALYARYRVEASRAARPEALARAVVVIADLAVPVGVAAALVTVGLVATSLDQAPSMILGSALAAAFALVSALVCGPAILSLAKDDRHTTGEARVTAWLARVPAELAGRLASTRRRAALSMVAVIVLMLAAAVPLLYADGVPFSATDLPVDAPARLAADLAGVEGGGVGPDALFGDLPLAAGVSAVALAVVLGLAFRWRPALPVALVSLLPAAAACGLCVLVFQNGHLAGAIGQAKQGALDTGAAASLLVALVSVSAARSAAALQTSREATVGGMDPVWTARWGASAMVPGVILATLIAAAATGVLAGASLYAAREFGLAVAVGLLLDLLLLRVPLIAALARWSHG
jgi:uncharacterized membrane protein YdfJ with MMPL/SSD domain